ncbi:MAG TPA: hypothetical protein VMT32_00620 [Bryobacteraceae bacterium]|nr:hypothetical protein [Bryobacteraceae bacterium]
MNETELDRLLDTWVAPAPPSSLREGLRARFPRAERRSFARPLGWVLMVAVASVTLAIGMGQNGENLRDLRLVRILNQLYEDFLNGLEAWQSTIITRQIRQSDPKVYVDGLLVAPLEYGPAASIKVQVPGDGVYIITSYPMPSHQADGGLTGWVEAGHIHGNVIEFHAGSKQVRIECNKLIVDSDRSVFVLRRP